MYFAVQVLPAGWSLAQITAHSLAANDGAKRASVDASTYTEVFGTSLHVCAAWRTLTGIAATETEKFHQVLIAGTYQLEMSPDDSKGRVQYTQAARGARIQRKSKGRASTPLGAVVKAAAACNDAAARGASGDVVLADDEALEATAPFAHTSFETYRVLNTMTGALTDPSKRA
jgi:hypothetical protein